MISFEVVSPRVLAVDMPTTVTQHFVVVDIVGKLVVLSYPYVLVPFSWSIGTRRSTFRPARNGLPRTARAYMPAKCPHWLPVFFASIPAACSYYTSFCLWHVPRVRSRYSSCSPPFVPSTGRSVPRGFPGRSRHRPGPAVDRQAQAVCPPSGFGGPAHTASGEPREPGCFARFCLNILDRKTWYIAVVVISANTNRP